MIKSVLMLAILFTLTGCISTAQGCYMTSKSGRGISQEDQQKAIDHRVNTQEFMTLYNQGAVVIDTCGKYNTQGILGSVSIRWTDLSQTTVSRVAPDKNQPVVLYDRDSLAFTRMIPSTVPALHRMWELGYTNVHILHTGEVNTDVGKALLPWGDLE